MDIGEVNSFRGQYAFLSNFYEADVTYQGLTFHSNEAAFQAQKATNEVIRASFCDKSASDAKRLGRNIVLRRDWDDVKVSVMKDLVEAKFDQHPELAARLLATGDAYLEEGNTWGDRVWGTVNGSGRNLLGQILMETREKIREKEDLEE